MKTMERTQDSNSTKTNFCRENFDTYFDAFISFSRLTCIYVNAHSGPFMQRLNWRNSYTMTIKKRAWENSWHFAMPPLVSPRNNVWGTTAEIPYWWRVTIQIWLVLLIGCADMEICFIQSDTVTRSWQWHANVTKFLRLSPRSHSAGKRLVAWRNVVGFLKLSRDLRLVAFFFFGSI